MRASSASVLETGCPLTLLRSPAGVESYNYYLIDSRPLNEFYFYKRGL